jgi:hypothetical protein
MQYVFIAYYFVPGITNTYLYRVDILLTYEKHMYDCIISTRGEIWAHITSLKNTKKYNLIITTV